MRTNERESLVDVSIESILDRVIKRTLLVLKFMNGNLIVRHQLIGHVQNVCDAESSKLSDA
jgi:hypothetical protein